MEDFRQVVFQGIQDDYGDSFYDEAKAREYELNGYQGSVALDREEDQEFIFDEVY